MTEVEMQQRIVELEEANKNLTSQLDTTRNEFDSIKDENKRLRDWNNQLFMSRGVEVKQETKVSSGLSDEEIYKIYNGGKNG